MISLVGFRVAHQAQIGSIGGDGLIHLLRTQVLHFHAGLRIASHELLLQAREFRQAHRINRRHANRAFHLPFQQVERRLKFIAPPQDVAAHVEIELASLGDCQRTVAAVQQRHPHLLFQVLQVLADGGLADAVHRSAFADAPAVRHIPEKLEAIEIHLTAIVLDLLMLCQSKFLLI